MKFYLIALIIINLMIFGFSIYNLIESKKIKDDISSIESKINRLDLDALEKIKTKELIEIDCNLNDPKDWMKSQLCN